MYLKKSTGLQTQSFSSLVLCDVTGNISLFCMCVAREDQELFRGWSLVKKLAFPLPSTTLTSSVFRREKKLKQLFYGQCFFHLKICKSWGLSFAYCLLSLLRQKKAHKYESSWSPFFAQRSFPLQVLTRLVA